MGRECLEEERGEIRKFIITKLVGISKYDKD